MNLRVVLLSGFLAATTWAGPLKFEPAEVDFGTKGQNLRLEAEVKLTNTSDKEIEVLSVASDCSCTAGEAKQKKLKPGESTTMPVVMETRVYQGPITRRLTVFTSTGSDEVRAKVMIRVFENWEVVPLPVMLPTSLRSQEASTLVIATYLGTEDVALLGATTDQAWLRAELNLQQGTKGGSVVLHKLTTAPAGTHQAQLILKTNDPKQPLLTMKVFVPVVSAATVAPNPIILPTVKAGTPTTQDIVVSGWEESTAPVAKLPLGSVEPKGRQPNGDYVFTVAMTPKTAGMSTQMLQLGADAATVLIEVPVLLKTDAK
jgi:hypothetical protein